MVPPRVGVDALIDPWVRLPGGSFFRAGGISDRAGRTSQIAGRCGHRPLRGRDVLGRTIENAGYHRLRTRIRPYETESVPPRVGVDALIDPGVRLPGGSFFRAGDILRFDLAGRTSQIAGRCRHRPLRGRDVLGFPGRLRTQGIAGPDT